MQPFPLSNLYHNLQLHHLLHLHLHLHLLLLPYLPQVDGAYAAVRFATPSSGGAPKDSKDGGGGGGGDDPMSLLAECRLLRKDDLMVVGSFSGKGTEKKDECPRAGGCYRKGEKKEKIGKKEKTRSDRRPQVAPRGRTDGHAILESLRRD